MNAFIIREVDIKAKPKTPTLTATAYPLFEVEGTLRGGAAACRGGVEAD